ncbi:MAG TPA: DUF433 domain-containing protein [Oscillatoriaceae cyanobacterium]
MDEVQLMERITTDPAIYGGKPIVRGRRLAVEHVLRYLAAGMTTEELRADFPWLEKEDVQACLTFALRAFQSVAGEREEPVTLSQAS